MNGPAGTSDPSGDRPEQASSEKPVDNGSDHETSVDGTDADESGYRRDDYWRAAQGERELDAGVEALRERDIASATTPAPSSRGPDGPDGPSGPSGSSSPSDPSGDDGS